MEQPNTWKIRIQIALQFFFFSFSRMFRWSLTKKSQINTVIQ